MPACLNSLPLELAVAVLCCLLQHPDRNENVKSFVAALCMCRGWYDIGLPILWTNIILDNNKIPIFTRAITSAHALLVKSLTLRITPVRISSIHEAIGDITVEPQQGFLGSAITNCLPFSDLGNKLHQMRHLKTLSITVTYKGYGGEPRPHYIEQDSLFKILLALPKSVEDLEVNILGFCLPKSGKEHICSILNKLLFRLRNVKIFVDTLCPKLFELAESPSNPKADKDGREEDAQKFAHAKFPNLRTFILYPSYESAALCPSIDKPTSSILEGTPDYPACIDNMPVVEAAEAAFAGNHLPAIQRFAIIDKSDTLDIPNDTACASIFERDFIARETFCNPLVDYTTFRGYGEYMMRYKDKNGGDVEALGTHGDVLEQVTGPAWIETLDGSRFPAEFKETRKAIEGGYIWKESKLIRDSGKAVIFNNERNRWIKKLLRSEGRAGRWLLKARTVEGVTDIAPIFREVLEDESDHDDSDDESDDESDSGLNASEWEMDDSNDYEDWTGQDSD
jgi:hypothetical protein